MLTGPLTGTSLADWLDGRRRSCDMAVRQIPWDESREWIVEPNRIRHVSDAFFSIVGRGAAGVSDVNQPLIDQPEVGILGMLVRRDNGTPQYQRNNQDPQTYNRNNSLQFARAAYCVGLRMGLYPSSVSLCP